MIRTLTVVLLLSALALPARAETNLDAIGFLTPAQFRLLSTDLTAALSYKAVIPAEPLGITGFDLGFDVTATQLENSAIFNLANTGASVDTLVIPKVHLHKGLPFGIDVGAFYAAVPDSNISLWGGELRYAIVSGGVAVPAVAVRASYSRLTGVDQLDFDSLGLDLSVSKGFAFLTPYVGIGKVWAHSTRKTGVPLTEEPDVNKLFGGINMNFAFINFAVEVDRTGDTNSFTGKVGWRF